MIAAWNCAGNPGCFSRFGCSENRLAGTVYRLKNKKIGSISRSEKYAPIGLLFLYVFIYPEIRLPGNPTVI